MNEGVIFRKLVETDEAILRTETRIAALHQGLAEAKAAGDRDVMDLLTFQLMRADELLILLTKKRSSLCVKMP